MGCPGWITRFPASAHIQVWDNRFLEINSEYKQGLGWQRQGISALGHLDPSLVSTSLVYIVPSKLPFICVFSERPSGKLTVGGARRVLTQGRCVRVPGTMCLAASWCPSRKALMLLKESSHQTDSALGAQQEAKRCRPHKGTKEAAISQMLQKALHTTSGQGY